MCVCVRARTRARVCVEMHATSLEAPVALLAALQEVRIYLAIAAVISEGKILDPIAF